MTSRLSSANFDGFIQVTNETERLLVRFGNYLLKKYEVQVFSNDGKNTPLYQREIHDADVKNFYCQESLAAPELELPSAHQIGDSVRVSFGDFGMMDCEILNVHFSSGKVRYDIIVNMSIGGETHQTRIYNVDSTFVTKM